MRGDDDTIVFCRARFLDRGHEIREAFADAGAGFDHQMAGLREGGGDGFGHLQLLRARFVIGKALRDRAARV